MASWLRTKGYILKLIDCMDANRSRTVKKTMRKLRKLCSIEEYPKEDWKRFADRDDVKVEYCFGLTCDELEKRLTEIRKKAARREKFPF